MDYLLAIILVYTTVYYNIYLSLIVLFLNNLIQTFNKLNITLLAGACVLTLLGPQNTLSVVMLSYNISSNYKWIAQSVAGFFDIIHLDKQIAYYKEYLKTSPKDRLILFDIYITCCQIKYKIDQFIMLLIYLEHISPYYNKYIRTRTDTVNTYIHYVVTYCLTYVGIDKYYTMIQDTIHSPSVLVKIGPYDYRTPLRKIMDPEIDSHHIGDNSALDPTETTTTETGIIETSTTETSTTETTTTETSESSEDHTITNDIFDDSPDRASFRHIPDCSQYTRLLEQELVKDLKELREFDSKYGNLKYRGV